MLRLTKRSVSGFTLIELAIVLAVAGLLFVGLWRILSGGNTQLRDQSVATQHQQLVNAVSGFLAANPSFLISNTEGCGGTNCVVGAIISLPLPPDPNNAPNGTNNTGCHTSYITAGHTDVQSFCDFLPPGFTIATTNSYGQGYLIQILRDNSPPGSAPSAYSYAIVTTGGEIIPDTSGGRIAAAIGNDGGFIYSNSVCPPAAAPSTPSNQMACGAYGTWSTDLSVYGFKTTGTLLYPTTGGYVASRTYIAADQFSADYWLARKAYPHDGFSYNEYNTMKVPLFLGGHTLYFGNDWNWNGAGGGSTGDTAPVGGLTGTSVLPAPVPSPGPGAVVAQGGTIDMGRLSPDTTTATSFLTVQPHGLVDSTGGLINMQDGSIYLGQVGPAATNAASIWGTGKSSISLNGGPPPTGLVGLLSVITPNSVCTMVLPGFSGTPGNYVPCSYSIFATTVQASNLMYATALYAGTFVYQSSDRRLKEDIHPLAHALDDVMKLDPVSFKFKAEGKEGLGVIAQDLEKVYPQLVTPNGDSTVMKSVNYEGLIAPLISSVQELKRENDALRQRLDAQDAREQKLEQSLKH